MGTYLNEVVRYLSDQSWQIAVLTVIVAAGAFALQHHSAHVRYLLWLMILAKCLVPPLHTMPLRVLPPTASPEIPAVLSPLGWSEERSVFSTPAPPGSPTPPQREPAPLLTVPQLPGHRLAASGWLGVLWIGGAGAYLTLNVLRALRGQHWLRRTRRPLPQEVQADTVNLLAAYGLRRLPRIWMMEGVGQPFVWGLWRGSIYVPPGFLTIPNRAYRRDILAHELGHVRRWDAAVNTMQVLAQGLFWFHPLVWWANQRIRREREKCCDEMAVAHLGTLPKEYSAAIVSALIQAQESTRRVPSLAVAGPIKNVEERIKTMLKPGKKFYKRPSLIAATMVLLAAFLTVPTALVLTARAQTASTQPQAGSTPALQQAAAAGDAEKVKALLAKGANVKEQDAAGKTALHFACGKGHTEVAKLLLDRGAQVNAKSWEATTPLHGAAGSGVKQLVGLLLDKGADVDARNNFNETPLRRAMLSSAPGSKDIVELLVSRGARIHEFHLAAFRGDMEKLKKCLQEGMDIEAHKDYCGTALHVAAKAGRKDAAEFLLSKGAAVDATDYLGVTPLFYAARRHDGDMMDLLLAKGADINLSNKDQNGRGLLAQAIEENNKEAVRLLISKGAKVNAMDWHWATPLIYAIWAHGRANQKEIIDLLISKGADVNVDAHGWTPLYEAGMLEREGLVQLLIARGAHPPSPIHWAALRGDAAKVKSLIEGGFYVDVKDGKDRTPLCSAATVGKASNSEIAAYLLAKGADVNTKDDGGKTPLHLALSWGGGRKDMVELLLSKDAEVNAKDEEEDTPLHYACRCKTDKEVVELLLTKGAEVNPKDKEGRTPLHDACGYKADKEVVELLIAKGADLNARMTGGKGWRGGVTPLHLAAIAGRTEIVRLLLIEGAEIDVKSDQGQTPLHAACLLGWKETVALLIAKGAAINAKDNQEKTPLAWAGLQGHNETAGLLRDHGATE